MQKQAAIPIRLETRARSAGLRQPRHPAADARLRSAHPWGGVENPARNSPWHTTRPASRDAARPELPSWPIQVTTIRVTGPAAGTAKTFIRLGSQQSRACVCVCVCVCVCAPPPAAPFSTTMSDAMRDGPTPERRVDRTRVSLVTPK